MTVIEMFFFSVAVYETFPVEIFVVGHGRDSDVQNGARSDENMTIESRYRTFYSMVAVVCALSVTVCEIFSRNLHNLDFVV